MAVTSRLRADLRLITAVFRPVVLLLFLVIGLSLALMAPFLWLVFSESFIHNRWFRFTILVNICIYWFWALAVTLGDVRAVGSMRRAPPRRDWFAEVPRSTQPWASDLIDAVEWRFTHLRWRTRLLLSFVPGVAYRHEQGDSGEDWRMEIGLSTVAFLSLNELTALLVTSGLCRFRPVSRPHFLLVRLLSKAERGQSALPPHPGPFSFARCLVEGTVRALQPLPAQLEEWSVAVAVAAEGLEENTVRTALLKSRTAALLQGSYLSFYDSVAVKRGLMPPFVEGMWRLYGKTLGARQDVAFKSFAGLWVYERRLLEACLGHDCVDQLRPAHWNDVHQEVGPSWSQSAAEIRAVLGNSRVADIPRLVSEWRNLLRRWLIAKERAPAVTPDRQRELFLFLLGAALGAVLLQAG
jgi:hypothetical protein